MLRPGAADGARLDRRDVLASALTLAAGAICAVVIWLSPADRTGSLSVILGVAAIGAGILVQGERGRLGVSASFIVLMLAAAFLGPRSAVAAAILAELAATLIMRTKWRVMLLGNVAPAILPAALAALIVRSLASAPGNSAGFYLSVALGGTVALVLSFLMITALRRLVIPRAEQFGVRTLLQFLPGAILSILLAVAGVAIELKVGNAGIAFALAAVLVFSYMAHLLEQSRTRAQQYVALSWGVLAGLMRTMEKRDERAARHAAAVARFARDIAQEVGMSEAECELVHTAGLLHDIGRFALPDHVGQRGRALDNAEWELIQLHPEYGALMLRDMAVYGPVADIVLSHHERLDGMGYPNGLVAEEIPEIAKIISVAEVYDTLTASDTYRTQQSSFEALTELRRVAGTQLDERYVEALARLLSGEGVEYRHADSASFDDELGMQRRINQAGAGR